MVSENFDLAKKDPLEVYVTSSTEVSCDNKTMTNTFYLLVNGGASPYQIVWDGGTVEQDGMVMVTGDPGIYHVSVVDSEGCSAVESAEVLPNSVQVAFDYLSASYDTYQSNLVNYEISFIAEGMGEIETYLWDFGDGNLGSGKNPKHTYQQGGTYPVSLTVTDQYGCTASSIQEILIEESFIVMPNAFTPNGDGINDFFFPSFSYFTSLEFWIYNKWGETIYHTHDWQEKGWDGTLKGQEVPAGNYVYKLVYETPDGRVKEKTGVFLLIR
jgi:gliding motility-associated-like protein